MPRRADPVTNVCEGGDHQRRDDNRRDPGGELRAALAMHVTRGQRASNEPLARVGNVAQLRLLLGESLLNLGAKLVHLDFLLEETWAQTVTGSIDPSLRRRRRNAQSHGDLLNREVEVEMQKERLAIAVRQALYGSRQIHRFHCRLLVSVWFESRVCSDESKPPSPADVAALVDDYGQEPGAHGHARSELAQLPPRPGDGLLGGVLGLHPVAEHRVSQPDGWFHQRADEVLERCLVAGHSILIERPASVGGHDLGHTVEDTAGGGLVTPQSKSLRPRVTNWSRRGPVPTSSIGAPISSPIRST